MFCCLVSTAQYTAICFIDCLPDYRYRSGTVEARLRKYYSDWPSSQPSERLQSVLYAAARTIAGPARRPGTAHQAISRFLQHCQLSVVN